MNTQTKRAAFTIIEVMVTVTIIVLLATLSVVVYGSWRKETIATTLKSDLLQAHAAMEDARNFENTYPELDTVFTPSDGVAMTAQITGGSLGFCLNARSIEDPSIAYYIVSYEGDSGTTPRVGTCDLD